MTSTAPPSPMARVILLPLVLWQQEQVVTLKPKETKVLALCANTNLPAGRVFSVSLRDLDQKAAQVPAGIMALNFSTAAPDKVPGVAVVRLDARLPE